MKPNKYIQIFEVLKDLQWHKKSEFCRPYSQDDKRLREMHYDFGWIEYEVRIIRENGENKYSEYRITKINPAWWSYLETGVKPQLIKQEGTGQLTFA